MAIVDPRQHPQAPTDEMQYLRTMIFAGVSITIHLFAPILLALLLLGTRPPPPPTQARTIQIQRFDRTGKQLARIPLRAIRPQDRKKQPKPPRKLRGQVVDIAPTPDRNPPKDARFLSEHNTRVRKEMLSRYRRLRYKKPAKRASQNARRAKNQPKLLVASRSLQRDRTPPGGTRPKPKRKQTQPKRNPPPKRGTPSKRALQKGKGQRAKERGQERSNGRMQRMRLAFKEPTPTEHNTEPDTPDTPNTPNADGKGQGKNKGHGKGSPPAISLKPSFGTLSQAQGAPAPEHIPNMPEGEETQLNSRQWLYAAFFNRVKRAVSQHWDPAPTYQRRDPRGNVYGVKDRLTVLSITLKPDGALASADVLRTCGLAFLDQEAVRAFKAAHPFPNPPKGLVGADGMIRFRFSFFVYNSHRARFRIFR